MHERLPIHRDAGGVLQQFPWKTFAWPFRTLCRGRQEGHPRMTRSDADVDGRTDRTREALTAGIVQPPQGWRIWAMAIHGLAPMATHIGPLPGSLGAGAAGVLGSWGGRGPWELGRQSMRSCGGRVCCRFSLRTSAIFAPLRCSSRGPAWSGNHPTAGGMQEFSRDNRIERMAEQALGDRGIRKADRGCPLLLRAGWKPRSPFAGEDRSTGCSVRDRLKSMSRAKALHQAFLLSSRLGGFA